MPFDLDDDEALDPTRAGGKAAWLARARQAGLPVLPGVVVGVEHSVDYLKAGAEQLTDYGSGRARMTITALGWQPELHKELLERTADFSTPLVVRSSSVLEGSGLWSGAFTSYLDIHPAELPKAVVGCYASVFTQATVDRFAAAAVSPADAALAILVQPALDPEFGGTARIAGDEVMVVGVKGSPVPLVQGWDPGVQAKVTSAGAIHGNSAIDTLGGQLIREVAETLQRAQALIGANTCEWAVQDGKVWLLQAQRFAVEPSAAAAVNPALRSDQVANVARLVRRFPGPLGSSLVLPWAIADVGLANIEVAPARVDPLEALHGAHAQAAALAAEVWGLPKPLAVDKGAALLRELRGPDPTSALALLAGLRPPDRERAAEILSLVATVRRGLMETGAVAHESSAWHIAEATARSQMTGTGDAMSKARIGFDRWEPFQAAVVIANGRSITGTSAGPGVAFGRMCPVTSPAAADHFRPRDVVVAVHPVPGLAALLFDAAAVITTGGGPAAHLFESARSLGIPALCATRMEDLVGGELGEVSGEWALGVDGTSGTVHALAW